MLKAFDLTIITGQDFSESQDELDQLMANWHLATQASESLCSGLISLGEFEEIIDFCGIDVEDYSQQVEENVLFLAY